MRELIKKSNIKIAYIITTLVFVVPSIIYLIKNKSINKFNCWFTYFLKIPKTNLEAILGGIIFFSVIFILSIFMLKMVKRSTELFKKEKSLFIFILIVTILFALVLPFTTSDIFYYMGTGQLNARYGENPYYTSVKNLKEKVIDDEILNRTGVWENQTVVYGPLWVIICNIFAFISFDNSLICLYVFKLFAIIIHILTCILIYKITNNKKYVILYGLNPFILFEMITNVHNDLYLIFFMLLAIYCLKNKKNVFYILLFSACAVAIKYVAILILPFMIIYYYRNYKILKRILYCFLCALLFIIILSVFYIPYFNNIDFIFNVLEQQNKYRESILAIVLELSNLYNKKIIFSWVSHIFKMIFYFIYLEELISFMFRKKITTTTLMRTNNKIIFSFLFLVITNLCPWYTSWLSIAAFWQKSKMIKLILFIQISYELMLTYNFMLFSESYKIGLFYLPVMVTTYFLLKHYNIIKKKNNTKIVVGN